MKQQFDTIIKKGPQIVKKLTSNVCESMHNLKTKFMPKRLNMRRQYILRINMAILSKHKPSNLNDFIDTIAGWREKLLEQCQISFGEKIVDFLMEDMKKKRRFSNIKQSEEVKKRRLFKSAVRRKKVGSNSPDKYKGKRAGGRAKTVSQLKKVVKKNNIPVKGLEKKKELEQRMY